MSAIIEINHTEWALVEDLFDPPGREGKPARYRAATRGLTGWYVRLR